MVNTATADTTNTDTTALPVIYTMRVLKKFTDPQRSSQYFVRKALDDLAYTIDTTILPKIINPCTYMVWANRARARGYSPGGVAATEMAWRRLARDCRNAKASDVYTVKLVWQMFFDLAARYGVKVEVV